MKCAINSSFAISIIHWFIMKKILFLILISCTFYFSSCQNNSPKFVAEHFLTAISHANLEEAKKYCDSNTKELLDQANYLNMVPDSVKKEAQKLKIFIKDVKENGNTALVSYTTSKLEEQQFITLVKEDDKWLVQLDKMQDYDDIPTLAENNESPVDTTHTTSTDTSQKSATTDSTQK